MSKYDLLRHFQYGHLPAGPIREISKRFSDLAHDMAEELNIATELEPGLRKLIEAKDCFVRAAIEVHNVNGEQRS